MAKRIAELLAAEAGTAAILDTFTLERSTRDLGAAIKHLAMSTNIYVIVGRHALALNFRARC
ncbi:hypothetical protein [Neorhizobium sp. DAR64872/K0K18]|uniref:hypothetical protein n=1 Tax=Neorhizobium sp. DAR64872/K0K18 TaxID=3421958 RepID=UPI003D2A1603